MLMPILYVGVRFLWAFGITKVLVSGTTSFLGLVEPRVRNWKYKRANKLGGTPVAKDGILKLDGNTEFEEWMKEENPSLTERGVLRRFIHESEESKLHKRCAHEWMLTDIEKDRWLQVLKTIEEFESSQLQLPPLFRVEQDKLVAELYLELTQIEWVSNNRLKDPLIRAQLAS